MGDAALWRLVQFAKSSSHYNAGITKRRLQKIKGGGCIVVLSATVNT